MVTYNILLMTCKTQSYIKITLFEEPLRVYVEAQRIKIHAETRIIWGSLFVVVLVSHLPGGRQFQSFKNVFLLTAICVRVCVYVAAGAMSSSSSQKIHTI